MRGWLVLLAGCGGAPNLLGGDWAIRPAALLPGACQGDPECQAEPDCELLVTVTTGELDWRQDCDRTDLPKEITEVDTPAGHVYDVVGGNDAGATWWVRDGTQPGLFELWVFDLGTEIPDRTTCCANVVLDLWDSRDTLQ